MPLTHLTILALIQGLTEFLPISSSGHLIIFPKLLNWHDQGITIDLRLSPQAIAEAIGSTRVTITRLLGDLRNSGLVLIDRKKITVLDPIALTKRFN